MKDHSIFSYFFLYLLKMTHPKTKSNTGKYLLLWNAVSSGQHYGYLQAGPAELR